MCDSLKLKHVHLMNEIIHNHDYFKYFKPVELLTLRKDLYYYSCIGGCLVA